MSVADAFWAAPPISRTITAAAVLVSVPGHLGIYNILRVVFFTDYVFTLRQFPEVWRIVTCFFITGPQLGMIFDPYFLYTYSSQLETGSARFSGPGSYFLYIIFVSIIILLTGGIYLGGMTLLPALSMAIMYIYAQEDPDRQIMFFILQMPAKYLPYASLAVTFLMAGPGMAYLQATGILAAHAYEFFDRIWPQFGGGRRLISTPQFVQNWFAPPPGQGVRRAAGTAYPAAAGQTTQRPTGGRSGLTSGFSSGSFGAGRRLGGE